MSMITIENLSVGFRGPPLLDCVSCRIESNQKIGLLGRNGSGKTTLMRILSGDLVPDSGNVVFTSGIRVSLLQQEVPLNAFGTITEIVASGLRATIPESTEHEDWRWDVDVNGIISRMQLDPLAQFEKLSSGMKRRVLLARAIVSQPDLLLLDEPTNHLDIDAIAWLETFLGKWAGALMFVTHDRMFLRRIATRILEIDRGKLFDWTCDYDTFLLRKEDLLAAEEKQNALFDKRLAEEEVWIRQGIKARRTRNEGRVRDLKRMREERNARREQQKTASLRINEGQKSGMLVIEAKDVAFDYGQSLVFSNLTTSIMRGDKIGIIGPNGAGKTTLLKVLLGSLPATRGQVRLGSNLEITYFDQLREQLDEEKTVQDNVGDGYDVVGSGESRKHILGYLQEFLFTPERSRTPVKFLSGGERNRILLAKLFTKQANVIVLDEPTNDLDSETLEMLEQRLVGFGGTILLVSHDRTFLNNVVASCLVFEDGHIKEYVGGYDDWIRQRAITVELESEGRQEGRQRVQSKNVVQNSQTRRLKFNEKQELVQLPELIDSYESQINILHELMANPDFYQQGGDAIARTQKKLTDLEQKRSASYRRWEELDALNV